MWYGDNNSGYVARAEMAGHYTEQEAKHDEKISDGEIQAVPVTEMLTNLASIENHIAKLNAVKKELNKLERSKKLKCYFGGSKYPMEYDFVEICFATSAREAKRLMWNSGHHFAEACDCDWLSASVKRRSEFDSHVQEDKSEPYVVTNNAQLRSMGFMQEGDDTCDHCGLSEYGGEFPVCQACRGCVDCGCDDDCESIDEE